MTSFPLRLAAVLTLAAAQAAPGAEPAATVLHDATGCGVVDPLPKPGESVTWSGACKDGLADGAGTLQWRQGDVLGTTYSGSLSAGKLAGHGIETFPNGSRFEGSFVDGRRQGHGVSTWPGGLRYEGDFVDGQRDGHGVFDMGGGLRYDGAFARGDMTGEGSLAFMGARLDARFTRGQLSGAGVLVQQRGGAEHRLPVDVGDAPPAAAAAASAAGSTVAFAQITDFRACRPVYPPMALRTQAMGMTTLALFVDAQGQVQRVRLVHASGADFAHGLLDLSALVSLAACPIAAARIDGKAAEDWLRVDYRWRLE